MLVAGSVVLGALLACGSSHEESATEEPGTPDAAPSPSPDTGLPQPEGPPKRIFAKRFVVNVREGASREAMRIGYMRAGAVIEAKTAGPISLDGCRGGWFELTTGGFVCNGADVIAFEGRRFPERRPAQPNYETLLPYRFARTKRDNTPMYRRPPTDDEAAIYEGYKIPGFEVVRLEDGGIARVPVAEVSSDQPLTEEASPAIPTENVPPPSAQPPVAQEIVTAVATSDPAAAEGQVEPSVTTLDALNGDRHGVVARRLVKGFIVSLDRDMRFRARRYWRTLSNGFVPYATQVEVKGSEFHGQELDGETSALPIGFVLSSKTQSFTKGRDGHPRRGRAPGYHASFRVTGRETHRDREYLVAADGALYLPDEVTLIEAHEPPSEVGAEDRWIEVDLGLQTLVAYEGRRPVYATLVSTGRVRDPDDPLRDMRTPTGLFRITSKHVTHTMDGDHAVDGPYSIEDVPYVMYFQLAYALHSAFWHDGFGRPRSHGCINLAPLDARWMFEWATPNVPRGWHGAYPTTREPGTWLWIHGETPEG